MIWQSELRQVSRSNETYYCKVEESDDFLGILIFSVNLLWVICETVTDATPVAHVFFFFYHNDSKFLVRRLLASGVDPDQTAPEVWSGSTLFAIPSTLFLHINL